MSRRDELIRESKKFNKIVIWGLKSRFHTHRYIHLGFFTTLQKLGIDVLWVDDDTSNNSLIKDNDLVISADIAGYNLALKKNVYYCLHNFDLTGQEYDPDKCLKLQVYKNEAEGADEKIDEVTFFDHRTDTLYQPWGTNLLESEFRAPVAGNHRLPVVFWIGSIWDNELHQGNINEMAEFRRALWKHRMLFIPLYNRTPESLSISITRLSHISPAIAGRWQVENNYLPCRMFKNISYGVLGISNVRKFESIFPDCSIKGNSIEEQIGNALQLTEPEMRSLIISQQEMVKKHTYVEKLLNIMTYVRSLS